METKAGTNPVMLQLAGKKLRSKLSSRLNESASMGVSSFARRQLEAMGWTEGTGLGKRRTGMKTHITVQKRDDEQGGLGKKSDAAALHGTHDWWKNSLEATLSKLSSGDDNKKKKKKSRKSKKEKESGKKRKKTSYTDEELFEATGGARFGMRAQAPQRGKWQRAEKDIGSSSGDKNGDDDSTPKAEWDGLSDPKVLLSSATPPPKKKRKLQKGDDDDDKVKETHEISDKEDDDDEEQQKNKLEEKKAKKDKSKKKKEKKLSKKDKESLTKEEKRSLKEKRKMEKKQEKRLAKKEKKESSKREKSHEVTSSSSESEDEK